jgi:hypothetical protein
MRIFILGSFMTSFLRLMTRVIPQKRPLLGVMRGVTKKVMKKVMTRPLWLSTAELSELLLGCPPVHSAIPWDASTTNLAISVAYTMAPMHVKGASSPPHRCRRR